MPKNKLPNVVLEPLDEPIELVDNVEDLVEHTKREAEDPFVRPEPVPVPVPEPKEEKLNYNNLTAKKLKDLCKSKGYKNYSKLKKCDLIKMLRGEEVEIPVKKELKKEPKTKKSIDIDTEKVEVIEKDEEIKPKTPIKKKELRSNLIKEKPLITDEEIDEILEEEPPKKLEKPIPKLEPQVKNTLPQQVKNVLPPQPQKPLYNPFVNYYNLM
jgi:hypothetical protein